MSLTTRRMLSLFALAVLLAVAGVAGSAALAREADTVSQSIPCDPKITRTASPLIVEEGGELSVRVEYTTECTGESPILNFFILVENTSALRGSRMEVLNNAKRALNNFVNQADYGNGSKGGLTLYASTYTNRVTLRGGDAGRDALLQAIKLISTESIGEVAGATGAIRDSSERLPTGVQGTNNALFILDSGAPMDPNGPTMSDLGSACKAAVTSDVQVYVVGRPTSGNRLCGVDCCNGGFKFSSSSDGADLPQVFDAFASEVFQGGMATGTEYYDSIHPKFEFVPGSGVPVAPAHLIGNEYSWQFPPPGLTAQVIEYKVRVAQDTVDEMVPLSLRSELWLTYQNGTQQSIPADNPTICVHKKGDPSFCNGPSQTQTAIAQPTGGVETATPPPPTATATETVSVTPPTEVPTETPSPTDGPGFEVYLPALLNKDEF